MAYPAELKAEVLELGSKGWTYTQIRKKHPIPKSTLSVWFKAAGKEPPSRERQLQHLVRARSAAAISIQRNKEARLNEAARQASAALPGISLTDKRVCKALLAMLYWAEGTKADTASLIFVNTDPVLASFYLNTLRAAYPLDESKLRIRLHLHNYHNHKQAQSFWSNLLTVPESQFGKIYVKKRSTQKKFRKNFQGICSIVYHDKSIRRELLAFGQLLAEKQRTLLSFNG